MLSKANRIAKRRRSPKRLIPQPGAVVTQQARAPTPRPIQRVRPQGTKRDLEAASLIGPRTLKRILRRRPRQQRTAAFAKGADLRLR